MLDLLSCYSGIKKLIGTGMISKEQEEQKEFDLLKYQILSGNNSRKGLEKMKRFVEAYLRENKIDKR